MASNDGGLNFTTTPFTRAYDQLHGDLRRSLAPLLRVVRGQPASAGDQDKLLVLKSHLALLLEVRDRHPKLAESIPVRRLAMSSQQAFRLAAGAILRVVKEEMRKEGLDLDEIVAGVNTLVDNRVTGRAFVERGKGVTWQRSLERFTDLARRHESKILQERDPEERRN